MENILLVVRKNKWVNYIRNINPSSRNHGYVNKEQTKYLNNTYYSELSILSRLASSKFPDEFDFNTLDRCHGDKCMLIKLIPTEVVFNQCYEYELNILGEFDSYEHVYNLINNDDNYNLYIKDLSFAAYLIFNDLFRELPIIKKYNDYSNSKIAISKLINFENYKVPEDIDFYNKLNTLFEGLYGITNYIYHLIMLANDESVIRNIISSSFKFKKLSISHELIDSIVTNKELSEDTLKYIMKNYILYLGQVGDASYYCNNIKSKTYLSSKFREYLILAYDENFVENFPRLCKEYCYYDIFVKYCKKHKASIDSSLINTKRFLESNSLDDLNIIKNTKLSRQLTEFAKVANNSNRECVGSDIIGLALLSVDLTDDDIENDQLDIIFDLILNKIIMGNQRFLPNTVNISNLVSDDTNFKKVCARIVKRLEKKPKSYIDNKIKCIESLKNSGNFFDYLGNAIVTHGNNRVAKYYIDKLL